MWCGPGRAGRCRRWSVRAGERGPEPAGLSCPTGGGGSAGREAPAESPSFPRLPPQLPPDLSPAPNTAARREEPARAGPLCVPHPGPPPPGTAKAGRPCPGDGRSRRLPFHPTLHLLVAFVWGRWVERRRGSPGVGVARVRSRARPRGSRTFSPLPLSGGWPGAAPLSLFLLGRGIALRGSRSLGGASGCPAGETRVSPFRGEGEAGALLPAALLPAPRVARRHLPRRQVATSWCRPPAAGLRPRRETIPRAVGEEEEEGAGGAALARRRWGRAGRRCGAGRWLRGRPPAGAHRGAAGRGEPAPAETGAPWRT